MTRRKRDVITIHALIEEMKSDTTKEVKGERKKEERSRVKKRRTKPRRFEERRQNNRKW